MCVFGKTGVSRWSQKAKRQDIIENNSKPIVFFSNFDTKITENGQSGQSAISIGSGDKIFKGSNSIPFHSGDEKEFHFLSRKRPKSFRRRMERGRGSEKSTVKNENDPPTDAS